MRQREGTVNEDPSLADIFKEALEARLVDLHTCMPATVVSYDAQAQKARVRPDFSRRFRSGTVQQLPIIDDVPVRMPRTGAAYIHLPLKAGDKVTLHFHERSLDTWKETGEPVDPGTESRKHALSDAYAEVGGYPFSDPVEGSAEDILIVNDKAKYTLKPNGRFRMENGAQEAFELVSKLIDICGRMKTNTIFGPLQVNEFKEFINLKKEWDKLKG